MDTRHTKKKSALTSIFQKPSKTAKTGNYLSKRQNVPGFRRCLLLTKIDALDPKRLGSHLIRFGGPAKASDMTCCSRKINMLKKMYVKFCSRVNDHLTDPGFWKFRIFREQNVTSDAFAGPPKRTKWLPSLFGSKASIFVKSMHLWNPGTFCRLLKQFPVFAVFDGFLKNWGQGGFFLVCLVSADTCRYFGGLSRS